MATIRFEANRAYPSQPDPGGDLDSHTASLRLIRESIEIHERRTPNYLDSFVRVHELIDLGLITVEGNQVSNTVGGADASGIHNDLTGRDVVDSHPMSAITGLLSSQSSQNAAISLVASDLADHEAEATIHFTEASIDHANILNIGTKAHTVIDTHIDDTTIHFTMADVVTAGDSEWLRLDCVNDPLTETLETQALLPVGNKSRDIGSFSLHYRDVFARRGHFIDAAAGVSISSTGSEFGLKLAGNYGTQTLSNSGGVVVGGSTFINSAYYPPTLLIRAKNRNAVINPVALAFGYLAEAPNIEIGAEGAGNTCFPYVQSIGGGGTLVIKAGHAPNEVGTLGSVVFGYIRNLSGNLGSTTVQIKAFSQACLVQGGVEINAATGPVELSAYGAGAMARGLIKKGNIWAAQQACFSSGFSDTELGHIWTDGNASVAIGLVRGNDGRIEAMEESTFAFGLADNVTIRADAVEAVQFFEGTNSVSGSFQLGVFGTGPLLRKTGEVDFLITNTVDLFVANDINIADAGNILIDSVTGSVIGQKTSKFAFHSQTPVAQSQGWQVANHNALRMFDVNSATLNDALRILGTIITALLDKGVFAPAVAANGVPIVDIISSGDARRIITADGSANIRPEAEGTATVI